MWTNINMCIIYIAVIADDVHDIRNTNGCMTVLPAHTRPHNVSRAYKIPYTHGYTHGYTQPRGAVNGYTHLRTIDNGHLCSRGHSDHGSSNGLPQDTSYANIQPPLPQDYLRYITGLNVKNFVL